MNYYNNVVKKNMGQLIISGLVFNFFVGIVSVFALMFPFIMNYGAIVNLFVEMIDYSYTYAPSPDFSVLFSPFFIFTMLIAIILIILVESFKKAALLEGFAIITNGNQTLELKDYFKLGVKNYKRYFVFSIFYSLIMFFFVGIILMFTAMNILVESSPGFVFLALFCMIVLFFYVSIILNIAIYKMSEGFKTADAIIYAFSNLFTLNALKYVGVLLLISIGLGLINQLFFGILSIAIGILEGVYMYYLYAIYRKIFNDVNCDSEEIVLEEEKEKVEDIKEENEVIENINNDNLNESEIDTENK